MRRGAVDDERILERRLFERRPQGLGLGVFNVGAFPDHQAAGPDLGRQRVLERQRPHLLRQVMRVAARDRTHGPSAAAELWHPGRAVTGAAGALLLVHLLAGAVDVRAPQRLMRAALAPGALPG